MERIPSFNDRLDAETKRWAHSVNWLAHQTVQCSSFTRIIKTKKKDAQLFLFVWSVNGCTLTLVLANDREEPHRRVEGVE